MKVHWGILLLFVIGLPVSGKCNQAYFRTGDEPFTQACSGGPALDAHTLVYLFIDPNSNGPDSADYQPYYVALPGEFHLPEDPVYSFSNFALQPGGTMDSPLFWGPPSIWGPIDTLSVYLLIYYGTRLDSCYLSPTIRIPSDSIVHMFDIPRGQWTCTVAPFPPPSCHGSESLVSVSVLIPSTYHQCITTCRGNRVNLRIHGRVHAFRPPAVDLTLGCFSECTAARNGSIRVWSWWPSISPYPDLSDWQSTLIGTDVGCLTINLLDSIPSAHLDTMTARFENDTVDIYWTTSAEYSLNYFRIWQPRSPYSCGPWIGLVPSTNQRAGDYYSFRHVHPDLSSNYLDYVLEMVDRDGRSFAAYYLDIPIPSHSAPSGTPAPEDFRLTSYPNPFNPATTLAFTLAKAGMTTLAVYDITGRTVQTLQSGVMDAGEHNLKFDGAALPSGLYFARIESGEFTATQKLLLLK
jgi:hypothetical protein